METPRTEPAQASRKPRLLLIGPKISGDDPVGGAKVLFGEVLKQFEMRDSFDVTVVSTTREHIGLNFVRRTLNHLVTFIKAMLRLVVLLPRIDVVMMNVSWRGALTSGPFVALLCKLMRVPFVVRFFGGRFDERFFPTPKLYQLLARKTYLAADLVLMETHLVCDKFKHIANVHYFPNTRNIPVVSREPVESLKKLLFISQLRPDKGWVEVLQALDAVPQCTFDIYGPAMPGARLELIEEHPQATYHGILSPDDVPKTLREHDLLVLPTYTKGEGYPGILLEALQCGTPVLTTRFNAIPEIVSEGGGILVDTESVEQIRDALLKLTQDPESFRELARQAPVRGEFFRSKRWYDYLESELQKLAARK